MHLAFLQLFKVVAAYSCPLHECRSGKLLFEVRTLTIKPKSNTCLSLNIRIYPCLRLKIIAWGSSIDLLTQIAPVEKFREIDQVFLLPE